MTRKNSNSHRLHENRTNGSVKSKPTATTARIEIPRNPQLSLYIPQSRKKNSPRRNLASPIQTHSAKIATIVNDTENVAGNGGIGDEEEEEQSEDVDDDNICLICVAKCTCGKNEQQQQRPRASSPIESHSTRQGVKLRLSSPAPIIKRRGRPTKLHSAELSGRLKNEADGHNYSTRSHTNVIVRDGRGRGRNGTEKIRRASEAKSDITMDISDVNLNDGEEDEDEEEDDDESDDLGDSGDDVDIEGEEERAIIAEESRRLKSYSEDDDDADEDDELDEEEDLFQVQHYTSSESSPDEDHEFYQNDLYLDATFCRPPEKLLTVNHSSPRRNSNQSDNFLYENPILQALIEEQGFGSITPYGEDIWHESEDDRVGWECFIDDTDVDMGDDLMHIDDESTRFGGGDTTDEEDFKLLGPPAAPPTTTKKKQKKSNDIVADVVTTAHQPPPLATWERDGAEITIIDVLPSIQSQPSVLSTQTPPPLSPVLPAIDEFFDSSLLIAPTDDECLSDASASSRYTVTHAETSRSRKGSTATATSLNTDIFVTPANRGRDKRKVPLGSYRRKVMLGERSLEAQEKSVFLKEWYTLQERRNLRKMSKSQLLDFQSSPTRGRRREKLRTARRARRDHEELDIQFIKRRRTSDVQGSGSSTAAFMERLGLELGVGDMSDEEEEYDEEYDEFETESRIVNGVGGERMVLDDDLELAQFIVGPPEGIDLSPLFGAVDAS
jgi:hypothetical protein